MRITNNYSIYYNNFTAPTGSPLNERGSVINSTAIIFTWDHPAADTRNGLITGYSLILLEQTTNTSTLYSQTGGRIELVINNLHPYYDYECRIAAETSVGRGPYGPPFTTRTLQDGNFIFQSKLLLKITMLCFF